MRTYTNVTPLTSAVIVKLRGETGPTILDGTTGTDEEVITEADNGPKSSVKPMKQNRHGQVGGLP